MGRGRGEGRTEDFFKLKLKTANVYIMYIKTVEYFTEYWLFYSSPTKRNQNRKTPEYLKNVNVTIFREQKPGSAITAYYISGFQNLNDAFF